MPDSKDGERPSTTYVPYGLAADRFTSLDFPQGKGPPVQRFPDAELDEKPAPD